MWTLYVEPLSNLPVMIMLKPRSMPNNADAHEIWKHERQPTIKLARPTSI